MSNANKLLLQKYVNLGIKIPENQFNRLSPSMKKDYIRRVQTFNLLDHGMMYILPYISQLNGGIYVPTSNLTSLGNLEYVTGMLDLQGCANLESLGNLREVGRYFILEYCVSLTSLGNLVRVGDSLDLRFCTNLESMGNLEYVGRDLRLNFCENLKSFGNLKHVVGDLRLIGAPLAEMYSEEQIREKINVGGKIYM